MRTDTINLNLENFPIERYQPIRSLGRGALGEVFLCEDLVLTKTVAVKRLHALTDDRVVLFHREAKIASKMSHNNIIKVFDFGITRSGSPFMVLEYFEGQSLETVLEARGKLDEKLVLQMFLLICDALQYMHENKIFHRDLKPANILVTLRENELIDLRIIDFGLSSIKEDWQTKTLVQGKTIVGTPVYMSPDTVRGETYDARSEVYSVACLMFEALTGDVPFEGEAPVDILEQHMNNRAPKLSEVAPHQKFSNGLEELIDRSLSKEKSARYQSMTELMTALKSVGQKTEVINTPEGEFKSASKGKWVLIAGVTIILISGIAIASVFILFPEPGLKKEEPKAEDTLSFSSYDGVAKQKPADKIQAHLAEEVAPAMEVAPEQFIDPNGCLDVKGPVITEQLASLKKAYITVRNLAVVDATVTADDISAMAELKSDLLDFFNCKFENQKALVAIPKLTSVRKLSFRNMHFSPKDLAMFQQMNNLEGLVFGSCDLTDEHMKNLAGVPFRKLVLDYNPRLTVKTLAYLGRPERSIAIWVNQGPLTDLNPQQVRDVGRKYHVVLINPKATKPPPKSLKEFF